MSAMMSRPESGAASASTELTHVREELSPSSRGVFFTIELTDDLPHEIMSQVQTTVSALHRAFGERVEHNDKCLELAFINRHSLDHTRSVTNGAVRMAMELGMPDDQVKTLAIAGIYHDVGYDFPEGADPAKRGKEAHMKHPKIGAEMFVREMSMLLKTNPDVRREVPWWTSEHMEIAWDAILNHSHTSQYDAENVSQAGKQLRFWDKMDNAHIRVYPSHLLSYASHLSVDPGLAMQELRNNHANLQRPLTNRSRRYTLGEVHERLEKFDKKYEHRLVPYAITGQKLRMNRDTGECEMHYAVDPDRITHLLQARCGVEKFMQLFHRAYGLKSMRIAAEVVHSIRNDILNVVTAPREKTLQAVFHFPDNHVEKRQFTPLFSL